MRERERQERERQRENVECRFLKICNASAGITEMLYHTQLLKHLL
jgi:hypothetical protein